MSAAISDILYRRPQDLAVTPTPLRRVIVVGSCLVAGWPGVLRDGDPGCPVDFFLFNNLPELPPSPPRPVSDYDFQLVQIPLRSLMPDATYFRLSYADRASYKKLFVNTTQRLSQLLAAVMRRNTAHGLLTFVCIFCCRSRTRWGASCRGMICVTSFIL